MNFREIIELLSDTATEDGMGGYTTAASGRTVFANQRSVRSQEFYQAQALGLRPELVFVIRQVEYGGERSVRWNAKDYDVLRTYSKSGEFIELVCSQRSEVTG